MWTKGMIMVVVGITGIVLTVICIVFLLIRLVRKEKTQLINKSGIEEMVMPVFKDKEINDETESLIEETELITEKLDETILLKETIEETELLNP